MLIWIVFAVMTAAVLAAVLRPLLRPVATVGAGARAGGDLAVYRDQLAELDADKMRGTLSADEAEQARREIARRMLAAAGDAGPASPTPVASSDFNRLLVGALAALMPVASLALYLSVGEPSLPARPFIAEKPQPANESERIEQLIAIVERRLQENPADVRGWDVIAPVYLKLGRFDDAANAFEHAMRLDGETAKRLSGFGEATVLAANGVVTPAAKLAYEKLRGLEPARQEPRFALALADEQAGNLAAALTAYQALAAETKDERFRRAIEERIKAIAGQPPSAKGPPPRGPNQADITAADAMTPEDRARMIGGMVEGLAARLAKQPNDIEGWLRLVRAYTVLGDRDKAHAALASARQTFKGEAATLGRLAALARELGIGS